MLQGKARILGIGGACAACAAGFALGALAIGSSPPREPSLPPSRTLGAAARAIATLQGPLRARKPGRVLAVLVRPGQRVEPGDPVAELEDLALLQSIRALRRQITEVPERERDAGNDARARAYGEQRAVRRELVQQLARAHQLAAEEMERWSQMHAEGLVARLDFERKRHEFEELGRDLREARRVEAQASTKPPESGGSPEIGRVRRLLARLEGLPRSFHVNSPWAGTVRSVAAVPGQEARQGTVIATVSRAILARLEARVGPGQAVLAVESACGVPGPLPFYLKPGKLVLASPAPGVLPGDTCPIVLRVRQ